MKQFFKFTLATIVGIFITTLLGILIFFGVVGAIAGSTEKVTQLKPNSVYQINLEGTLVDRSEDDPFSELPRLLSAGGETCALVSRGIMTSDNPMVRLIN